MAIKHPTSQMVASTQPRPVIAIGRRALKQPKLSRYLASAIRADEKVSETNNGGGRTGGREGWKRVNRSLVSASAKAGRGDRRWRIADSQVGEERERCKCEEKWKGEGSRVAIRSTSAFLSGSSECLCSRRRLLFSRRDREARRERG